MEKGYIKCPFCGEEIKEGAIKCRYCREFLDVKQKEEKEVMKDEIKKEDTKKQLRNQIVKETENKVEVKNTEEFEMDENGSIILKNNGKCMHCGKPADTKFSYKRKIYLNEFYFNVFFAKGRIDRYGFVIIPCCKDCHERIKRNKKITRLKTFGIASGIGLILAIIFALKDSTDNAEDFFLVLGGCLFLCNWIAFIVYKIRCEKMVEFDKVKESKEWKKLTSEENRNLDLDSI